MRPRHHRHGPDPEAHAPRAAHHAWLMAGVVLVVIGAAHLGLFLLLTASARGDVEVAEVRYGREALVQAEEPGARPAPGSDDLARWNRSVSLWEAHAEWVKKAHYVSFLGWALLASFLVQAVVLGAMLHRSTHARLH